MSKFIIFTITALIVGLALETIIKASGVNLPDYWIPCAIIGAAFTFMWAKCFGVWDKN